MADYEIIRRERITVESSEHNQYGDLIVQTVAGNEYKVSKKRAQLFAVFQDGAEVVIGWSSYMDKEYIAEATPASQVVSANTPITPEKPKEHEAEKVKEGGSREDKIDQAVIYKGIIELLSSRCSNGKSALEIEFPKNFLSFKQWALIYMQTKL